MDQPALLERADELGLLHGCAAEVVASGHGQVVLLFGEAGIGKTALLRRFRDELPRRVTVLWGTCDPLFTPRPLGPLLGPATELEGEPKTLVAQGAKPFDVAVAFVEALSAIAPAALIVEDLHWADEATLDVVRVLARRAEDVGLLLLLTYRSDQLHRDHPLRMVIGDLPRTGAVSRLELAPFSRDTVAELAARSELDAGELFDRTAGNPFFVTESLAAGTTAVPETVGDAVHGRIARLSADARALLDAVAVVPQRAEVWLLEALTDGTLVALDECLGTGVLRAEADGVVFRHELARLAIEAWLPPDQAVSLHRRALTALADPTLGAPDLARLAHHAEACRLGEPTFAGWLACWRDRAGLPVEPPDGVPDRYRLQLAGEPELAADAFRAEAAMYDGALAVVPSTSGAALRAALDQLHTLGAMPAAAIVSRRLRVLGERQVPRGPRASTSGNPAGLTNRELEVLPLLAEGLRNAEIAQRLVVSQKTIDHHVSAILRKLDVRTRGQAGVAASRLGLIPNTGGFT